MKVKTATNGFAIALAWPSTYCKEPGSWYDPVTRRMGISKNNYYQAGHAALVLIDCNNLKCHYFDFGRYHSPFKHGRVRSAETDHGLFMKTIPEISKDRKFILNYKEILGELQQNHECHGDGVLYSSYCEISFKSAYQMALQMQLNSPLPYGPFISTGSNCSRFVNTVIRSGSPGWKQRIRLKYKVPFTPTPMNNVNSLPNKEVQAVIRDAAPFFPLKSLAKSELLSTLSQPRRHPDIPENSQWLSGEGVGSWFVFEFEGDLLKLTRYAPNGKIECSGFYMGPNKKSSGIIETLKIDYPSNCKEVNLKNGHQKFKFQRIDKS